MTQFWWVRHGPTHHGGMVGWSDVPADLSDTAQIARLRSTLPKDALVVSSDLSRAVETANVISDGHERLGHDPALREISFGAWEGLSAAEIDAQSPDLARAYWSDPGVHAPEGGESWNDLSARVDAAVDGLIAAHAGRDIIVVAHFGVILTQIQRAAGMPARSALSFTISNLSLTRIEHLGPAWRIGQVNRL